MAHAQFSSSRDLSFLHRVMTRLQMPKLEPCSVCTISGWTCDFRSDQLGNRELFDPDDDYDTLLIDCVEIVVERFEAVDKIWNRRIPPHLQFPFEHIPTDGYFCFYNVASLEDFQSLGKFLGKHKFVLRKYATLWIVGVRFDGEERQVSFEAGEELANKYEALFSEIDDHDPCFLEMYQHMARLACAKKMK